VTPEIYFTLRK